MNCRCGKSVSRRPGLRQCSCGSRNVVVKNGDVGYHLILGRPGRNRGYVIKDGELKKRG